MWHYSRSIFCIHPENKKQFGVGIKKIITRPRCLDAVPALLQKATGGDRPKAVELLVLAGEVWPHHPTPHPQKDVSIHLPIHSPGTQPHTDARTPPPIDTSCVCPGLNFLLILFFYPHDPGWVGVEMTLPLEHRKSLRACTCTHAPPPPSLTYQPTHPSNITDPHIHAAESGGVSLEFVQLMANNLSKLCIRSRVLYFARWFYWRHVCDQIYVLVWMFCVYFLHYSFQNLSR